MKPVKKTSVKKSPSSKQALTVVAKPDPSKYTYRTFWSEEDHEYVGTCAQFPSLSHLDANQQDAFQGIVALVADVVADMTAKGEKVPLHDVRVFSGQFKVRIPTALHRRLVLEAEDMQISMNRLVSMRLAAD